MFKSNPFTNSAATASFSPRNGSVQPLVYPRPSFQAALTAEQHRALQEHHKIQIQQTIANKDKSTESLLFDLEQAEIENTNLRRQICAIQAKPSKVHDHNKQVVLLLDGRRNPFLDEYFQHGFRGGQYVANLFAQQIKHILPRLSPLWQPGQPIRIKYYMDIYATAQDLVDREVLVNVANLVAFLDGLSSQHLIDCIQVGSEESLASKVMNTARRHISDKTCSAVLIGSSMSDGVADELLRLIHSHPKECEKVRLLSGVDIAPEKLAFLIEAIPGVEQIFQSSHRKESQDMPYSEADSDSAHASPKSPEKLTPTSTSPIPSFFTPGVSRPALAPVSNSWAKIAKQATPPPGRSGSMSASDSRPNSRADFTQSFAKVLDLTTKSSVVRRKDKENKSKEKSHSSSKQEHPNLDVLKLCTPDEDGIYWSANDFRIDPCPKWYVKEEVERVKKLKLCNVNYLRPPCLSDKKCHHSHTYTLTQSELDTLALVARMSPCSNGPTCSEVPCIYGHNCPAPRQVNLSKLKGGQKAIDEGQLCIFGVECFFSGDMHHYAD